MKTLEEILAPYDYTVPQELIATAPAHPRDSARLLVHDRKTNVTSFDTFANITNYLPTNAVLVFNQTKVFPARMKLVKDETKGKVEALYLETVHGMLRVMASGKIAEGEKLLWNDAHFFTVEQREGKIALLQPSFSLGELHRLLRQYGETPLPPYIKNSTLTEEEKRAEYQTVFAKQEGSVAAPTAGLHFTPELLQKIKEHGCDSTYVTLHVNLGTFAPLTREHVQQKRLHTEAYHIDENTAAFLNKAKKDGRPIIAVGTTSVRTLESATVNGHIEKLADMTSIFITENDTLKFVDGLVTNLHVPKSSLLMLVSAFTGRNKLLDLYAQAIKKKFRFFSFGDGMLIL